MAVLAAQAALGARYVLFGNGETLTAQKIYRCLARMLTARAAAYSNVSLSSIALHDCGQNPGVQYS